MNNRINLILTDEQEKAVEKFVKHYKITKTQALRNIINLGVDRANSNESSARTINKLIVEMLMINRALIKDNPDSYKDCIERAKSFMEQHNEL